MGIVGDAGQQISEVLLGGEKMQLLRCLVHLGYSIIALTEDSWGESITLVTNKECCPCNHSLSALFEQYLDS